MDLVARLRLIDNMTAPARRAFLSMGSLAGKITGVGAAVGALTAGMSAFKVATTSFNKALDFEAQMSSIKALTGATTEQMTRMDDLALTMGAKTAFSALEAAAGIEELLKAGISPATVESGALEAALNLATAGGLGLANAAEIMSTALNSYKKDGMTAAHAANILAGTANASATGVEDLRQSLAAVSAVAAGIGMTFDDTNVALGLFANNGVKGSDAGTSLKTMLQNLQPGTREQIALFDKLGITTKGTANKFFTAEGKLESLDKVASVLSGSLGKMTDMQRQATLEVMFGTDAVRAGTILYNEGADGVKKFYEEMGGVTALDVAEEKMNNGRGAIEQFQGALETLQIRAVKPLLPAIKTAFTGMGDYVERVTPKVTAAMERMTASAKTYVKSHFIDNPDFQKIPDIQGKIAFIFEDLMSSYNKWFDGGGNKQIETAARRLTETLGGAVGLLTEPLFNAGVKLGEAAGKGAIEGVKKFADDHPLLAGLGAATVAPGGLPGKLIAGVGVSASSYEAKGRGYLENKGIILSEKEALERASASGDKFKDWVRGLFGADPKTMYGPTYSPGHAGGLDRVPYNGYSAQLHKDERVQTKAEADAYRSNRGGGSNGGGPLFTIGTLNVRKESDIDAIAAELAKLINTAEGASAYAG